MNYTVHYFCCSDIGKCRSMNQDNFICDGTYMSDGDEMPTFPLVGHLSCSHPFLVGVFDGMGGEECGEIASLIAAKCAAKVSIGRRPPDDLLKFCKYANEKICEYVAENNIGAMGTTAALLAFTSNGIALCNIGDSKIFRFADRKLEQISTDHYAVAPHGLKPPLSQNLGIPVSEMVIEPYVAWGPYKDGDIYLLSSDGLTDMVTAEAITKILLETTLDEALDRLLNTALENGGKDNITIILCKVEREKRSLRSRIFCSNKNGKGEKIYGK